MMRNRTGLLAAAEKKLKKSCKKKPRKGVKINPIHILPNLL